MPVNSGAAASSSPADSLIQVDIDDSIARIALARPHKRNALSDPLVLALREAFRRGSLVEITTPRFDLRRHFYFARHRQRPISPATREFLALCREMSASAADTDALPLPFIA